jgi:hypothetical protein
MTHAYHTCMRVVSKARACGVAGASASQHRVCSLAAVLYTDGCGASQLKQAFVEQVTAAVFCHLQHHGQFLQRLSWISCV